MKFIDKILLKLENCIRNDIYTEIETETLELKNMPANSKEFNSIKETVCAFLNTNGGTLIIGIKEKKKKYILKGYREDFEESFKQLHKDTFKDENADFIDVSEQLPDFQIKDFLDKRVAILYVDKLPIDKKFVYYNATPYERRITGDHAIEKNKILAHKELKEEIKTARELFPVVNANLDSLDIDKLNDYIYKLNREVKIVTIKSDINIAAEFLTKRFFIDKNKTPTTLGILVCGRDIDYYLGNKCQIDCFVNSPIKIAQNKKVIKDNVLPLLEAGISFVYRNIAVGINIENGGSSIPEYPEDLIRESVNNSIAHRDYTIDKFININITPNSHIEIRNPGSIKKSLLIEHTKNEIPVRRIIPNPKPVNPKLADVLKVFDKWEGKGIGMATLVNKCLENKIDLPYYRFYGENDMGLFIPSGKLLDDEIELLIKTYDKFISILLDGEKLTDEQKIIIAYIYKSEKLNELHRYTILLTADNNHLNSIISLEKAGIIYKHKKSDNLHPIYILNRELLKTNYNDELRKIIGKNIYDNLDNVYKNCLQLIYQFNEFSNIKYASANMVSTILFNRENKNITDFKQLDNYKRKIRTIFNKLENNNFIKRKDDKPKYYINNEYKSVISLFDNID